jgi:hypothetical protein
MSGIPSALSKPTNQGHCHKGLWTQLKYVTKLNAVIWTRATRYTHTRTCITQANYDSTSLRPTGFGTRLPYGLHIQVS